MSQEAKQPPGEASDEEAAPADGARPKEARWTLPPDIEALVERGAVVETVDGHRELEERDLFGRLLDWIADLGASKRREV